MAIPGTIPSNGLVGEWLLDGNALDTSGSGNNGTATNVTYTGTDRGYQSQNAVFNGTNAQVQGVNPVTLATTMSLWVKITNTALTNQFMLMGSANVPGALYFSYNHLTANQLTFANHNGASDRKIDCGALTQNVWYHIVGTRDASGNGVVYLNNVQIASGALWSVNTGAQLNIGGFSGYNLWTASNIQGCRTYNRVLSTQEIQSLYMEGLRKLAGAGLAPLTDGLVAYYDFNGDAQDIVGGNNGTVVAATLTTDNLGTANHAYSFNGSTGDIHSGAFTGYSGTQNLTTIAYLKPSSLPATKTGAGFITDNAGTYDKGFYLYSDGSVGFGVYDGAPKQALSSAGAISTGNYCQLVGTFDGTNIRLYINGVLLATTACSTTYAVPSPKLYLALFASGVTPFAGVYDWHMFFNRALSASEVLALYKLSSTRYLTPLLH